MTSTVRNPYETPYALPEPYGRIIGRGQTVFVEDDPENFHALFPDSDLIVTKVDPNYIVPAQDEVMRPRSAVTPEQYGAIGDGTTNDTAALQKALDSGRHLRLTRTYLVTGLTVSSAIEIQGPGTLKTATNAPILTIASDHVTVRGVRFLGDGKDSGKTSQRAVSINGKFRTIVSACRGDALGGEFVYVTTTVGTHQGMLVSACEAHACNVGLHAGSLGEYLSANGFVANGCNTGLWIAAGNFHGAGGHITNCGIGVLVDAGSNDAHGTISGMAINHCTVSVQCNAIQNGFLFQGCDIYEGPIVMNGTDATTRCLGVVFEGGRIDVSAYSFKANVTTFRNVLLPGSYANAISNDVSGTASRTLWVGCKPLGTMAKTTVEYNGGYSRVHSVAQIDFSAAQMTAEQTIKYATIDNNSITNHAAYTRDTFYDAGTGVWTAVGLSNDGVVRIQTNIRMLKNAGDSFGQIYVYLKKNGVLYAYVPVVQITSTYGHACASIVTTAVAGDTFSFTIGGTIGGGNTLSLWPSENFIEFHGL